MKKNQGITLIALVVTIIVLLILAGISIAILTGENGIISGANDAKESTIVGREKEEIVLAYTKAKSANAINRKFVVDEEDLQYALIENGVQNTNTAGAGERIEITYTDTGHSYYIDKNGNVVDKGNIVAESREGLKVGEYIDYTPDSAEPYPGSKLRKDITGSEVNEYYEIEQQNKLKWKILRIYDDGRMDLVAEQTTHSQLILQGAAGYNNGVYLVNDICKSLYSKPSKGVTARNIKYEDLESWLTEEGKRQRDNYVSEGGVKYGQTKTYTDETYRYYPKLYAHQKGSGINTTTVRKDGIGISNKSAPGFLIPTTQTSEQANGTGLTVTQNKWRSEFGPEAFGEGHSAIYTPTSYFVASRFVNCNTNRAEFGFFVVSAGVLWGDSYNTFFSDNNETPHYFNLRPVVTLEPDVKVTRSEGANSEDNPHIINW